MAKLTTEDFIRKARLVHGDRYDYSKVEYEGASNKVIIICPEHGDFEQQAYNHMNGYGCMLCAAKERGKIQKHTSEVFIIKAKEVHGEKYDYSKSEYNGNNIKVIIICPKHGEFLQVPSSHLQGQGCPKCAKENSGQSQRLTTEEFIQRAKEVLAASQQLKRNFDKYNTLPH